MQKRNSEAPPDPVASTIDLRASEIRYRRLFEGARDGILILNPDTRKIVDANPFMTDLLGYERDELLGRELWQIGLLRDEAASQAAFRELQEKDYVRYDDLPLKSKTGEVREVEFVSNVYEESGERVIQCNIRDIAERRFSEEQMSLLQTCLANLNDIILVTEAENLDEPGPKIIFVNEAFERITGYAPAEAIGRSPRFLQGEKTDRQALGEIRQALERRQPIRRCVVNYRKDGSEYLMDIDIVPIFDSRGKCRYFAAIERDVTERHAAEAALMESECKYRTIFDTANDAILMIKDGVLVDCNARALALLGVTRNQLIGKNPMAFSPPTQPDGTESGDWINERFSLALAGEPQFFEWTHCHSNGALVQTEVSLNKLELGGEIYIQAIARDITARKRTEEHLVEQAGFLDKAQDAIIARAISGEIVFWNKGAERIYGWQREEVLTKNLDGFLNENRERFDEICDLTKRDGKWQGELKHVTKGGRKITVEQRCTLIRDGKGHPKMMLAIITDITEKKMMEAQFMRAQRMESIGTLAAGIAHDLNNILSPIMMSIELIRGMVKEPEGRALVDNIGLSAQRGADIVKQVLSFARGLEGQRIEVQIKHLVSDIGGIIAGTFPKNIRFEDCVPFDTWTILGDPTQMHQVLLNLCVNARDAMPGGGVLRIDAVNRTLDEQYCSMYPQATPGKFVVIEVTDTGSGIPQNILDRIFEPFFTTKEVGKGTGLGLSTVFAIVKSHGGFITVRSEPGKGTTFSICFPAESSLVQTDRGDNLNSPPRGNGETILIIDDELSVLAVTRQTLEAFGYQAICASNGAEGIASYAAQRAKIAVVLTDLIMPVMDGIVTAREMKVIDPDVRIIIASGYNTDKQLAEANDLGFRDFLPKPYTARVLLEKLQSILQEPAKRSTGQELP